MICLRKEVNLSYGHATLTSSANGYFPAAVKVKVIGGGGGGGGGGGNRNLIHTGKTESSQ